MSILCPSRHSAIRLLVRICLATTASVALGAGVCTAARPLSPETPGVEVPETRLPRPLEDYENSSLLVLQFEPRGADIELVDESSGSVTHLPSLGSRAGLQVIRLFDLPGRGTRYRVTASKQGYLPKSVEINVRPRQLHAVDLLLSSEHDRDRVAFSAPGEGRTDADIFTIWPDGSHRSLVVSTSGDDTDPAFSPDGTRLAFSSDFEGDREIYVEDLESGQIARVTRSPGPDYSPTWSPDGQSIAFVSERTGRPTVWLTDVTGAGVRRLTRPRIEDRDPCFSPDDAWLVFAARLAPDLDLDLAVLELRTGKIFPLTDEPGEAREPRWSPDGKTIIYRVEREGRSTLELVAWSPQWQAGTPLLPVRLLEDRASCWSPRWSSEGDGLVFVRGPEGKGRTDSVQLRFALAPSALGPDRRDFSAEISEIPGPVRGLAWGKVPPDPNLPPQVRLETDQGSLDIQLSPSEAPRTVENFLGLVRSGFYNGLQFYRVVEGFVAQAGCPLNNGLGGPRWTIPLELSSLRHDRGAISMVHGPDPDSAGSQFFICLSDCRFLDGQFAVFGKVTSGMDVLDRVRAGTVIRRAFEVEGE